MLAALISGYRPGSGKRPRTRRGVAAQKSSPGQRPIAVIIPPLFTMKFPTRFQAMRSPVIPYPSSSMPRILAQVSLRNFELRDGESGQINYLSRRLWISTATPITSSQHTSSPSFPEKDSNGVTPIRWRPSTVMRERSIASSGSFLPELSPIPSSCCQTAASNIRSSTIEPLRFTGPRTGSIPCSKIQDWTFPKSLKVTVGWQDENTLLVNLQGKPCDRAGFSFEGGYRFSLVVAEPGSAELGKQACGLRCCRKIAGQRHRWRRPSC